MKPQLELAPFPAKPNCLYHAYVLCVGKGAYGDAIAYYTDSLKYMPSCLAYANRAMAQLKLGNAAEAEADCTAALELDVGYVKAYQRRATARRCGLGRVCGGRVLAAARAKGNLPGGITLRPTE